MKESSKGRLVYESYKMPSLSPDGFSPVELPVDDVFEESQPFSLAWLWVFMAIEILVVFIPIVAIGAPWWTFLLAGAFLVIGLSVLGATDLQTRMDNKGVYYRMKPFHSKPKFIPWDQIDMIQVRPYNPIREDGGYGLRIRRNRRSYNVGGKYCIALVTKKGRHIIIGTEDPSNANAFLSRRPLTV